MCTCSDLSENPSTISWNIVLKYSEEKSFVRTFRIWEILVFLSCSLVPPGEIKHLLLLLSFVSWSFWFWIKWLLFHRETFRFVMGQLKVNFHLKPVFKIRYKANMINALLGVTSRDSNTAVRGQSTRSVFIFSIYFYSDPS